MNAGGQQGGGRQPLVELRGIRAVHGRVEALRGVNLAVAAGGVCAVLGPNGAGKSTLLALVAGLHPPSAGELVMAGRVVNGVPCDQLVRAGVCLVPAGRGIFPNLTVRENLLLATYAGPRLAEMEERVYRRFPKLSGRRSQLAGSLSGGEQQMLALGRAVAVDPALLLVDEPSTGLAPIVTEQLYELLGEVAAEGVTTVVVEQFVAAPLRAVAAAGAILHDGRIHAEGPLDELADRLVELAWLAAPREPTARREGVTT